MDYRNDSIEVPWTLTLSTCVHTYDSKGRPVDLEITLLTVPSKWQQPTTVRKGLAAVYLGNLAVSKPAAAPKDIEKLLLRAFVEASLIFLDVGQKMGNPHGFFLAKK